MVILFIFLFLLSVQPDVCMYVFVGMLDCMVCALIQYFENRNNVSIKMATVHSVQFRKVHLRYEMKPEFQSNSIIIIHLSA